MRRQVGPYEVVREIGRGAFGVVYEGRHPELDQRVAIKVMNGSASPKALLRFEVEAQAAARLRHPGVVTVHDYGYSDGAPYMAMEFVEGESLGERLRERGPLPPREAARIVREIALGVGHAHQNKILHRDLKPDNVLLAEDGRVLVTDFGLARDMNEEKERLTKTGTMIGTPYYMPPEQASGDAKIMGPRGDVYSLGAVLYCALTGHPPHERDSQFQVLAAIIRKPPDPFSRWLDEGLDPELESVVFRCLEKEDGDRYPTAEALAEDLAGWLDGSGVSTSSASGVERARRWARRRQPLVIAGSLAALALGGLAVLLAATVGGGPSAPKPADEDPPILTLDAERIDTEEKTAVVRGMIEHDCAVTVSADAGRGGASTTVPAGGGTFALAVPVGVGRNEVSLEARCVRARPARVAVVARRFPEWFADHPRRPEEVPADVEVMAEPGTYRNERDDSLLVWIPPGSFRMGSGAATWSKSEVPAFQATLTRGFFLGVHELTWAAYTRFCKETGRALPSRSIEGHDAGDDEPVFNVTFADAEAYCAWAGLRLPTEAEWEYASRCGRETAIRPWTDEFHTAGRCNMEKGDPYPYTSPVGAFPESATPWGCQDMAGNVCEWVQDAWAFFTPEPKTDPMVVSGEDDRRVVRGGNWSREEWTMRCAWRGSQSAAKGTPLTGFRVAKDP